MWGEEAVDFVEDDEGAEAFAAGGADQVRILEDYARTRARSSSSGGRRSG